MSYITNKENYLIWEADTQSDYCVLGYLLGYRDDYKLMIGDSVASEWPADVRIAMDPVFKKQVKLSDNLLNPCNVIIASKDLQDFFKTQQIPNVQYLPITILNHKKKVASKDYCIVNLVTTQDCIDIEKSQVMWNDINPDYIFKMKKLIIDENKIDKNAILFRAEHLKTLIFIRKDLADKVVSAGFTNIVFWKTSDYR